MDIKGGQRFKESDSLSAGNQITTFDTDFEKTNQVRQQVPLISAKRTDLYQVIIQYLV